MFILLFLFALNLQVLVKVIGYRATEMFKLGHLLNLLTLSLTVALFLPLLKALTFLLYWC